jgi:hypothetical protein
MKMTKKNKWLLFLSCSVFLFLYQNCAENSQSVQNSATQASNLPGQILNGDCGSANGFPTVVAPTSNLCLAGSASSVTGTGPFMWSCVGVGGGTNASCSAPLATASTVELPGPSLALHAARPYYTCVTNRYVATAANGGSDSNDGTSPTSQGNGVGPWLTLTKANSALPSPAPGYCVNIGDGVYPITVVSLTKGGNVASKTGFTVYRSTNLLGAKFVAASNTFTSIQMKAPYLIIDGIDVDGKRYPNTGTAIDSCFNGTSYNGLHHLFVFNSYTHDFANSGIATCWAEYYWMIHNRSDNNAFTSWYSGMSTYQPIVIPGYVPTAYDRQFTPYHNVYAYNRFDRNFTEPAGGPHTDGNGFIYDDTQHTQSAPTVTYTPKALIMGNLSTNNGGAGIQIGPASANADIFNNTAYNNYRDTVNTGTWRGDISCSFCTGVTFKNNIGITVKGSGILTNNSPFISGNPIAMNIFSDNIAFGGAPVMYAPDTFSAAQNLLNTNPQLLSPSGGNFSLCTGPGRPVASCTGASPALGAGELVPYWHQRTPGEIDIGACPRGTDSCR